MINKRAGIARPLALRLLVELEQHISSQLLLLRYHTNRGWREPGFDGRVVLRVYRAP